MGQSNLREDRETALSRALRAMFRSLQSRSVPDGIRSVVDQLDEGEGETSKKSSRR